jgi:hypothetical protein
MIVWMVMIGGGRDLRAGVRGSCRGGRQARTISGYWNGSLQTGLAKSNSLPPNWHTVHFIVPPGNRVACAGSPDVPPCAAVAEVEACWACFDVAVAVEVEVEGLAEDLEAVEDDVAAAAALRARRRARASMV